MIIYVPTSLQLFAVQPVLLFGSVWCLLACVVLSALSLFSTFLFFYMREEEREKARLRGTSVCVCVFVCVSVLGGGVLGAGASSLETA